MSLIFKNRHGFYGNNGNKITGYIYEDLESGRRFSFASGINSKIFWVNELDENFGPEDNVYSTLTAGSIKEAKLIANKILEGEI